MYITTLLPIINQLINVSGGERQNLLDTFEATQNLDEVVVSTGLLGDLSEDARGEVVSYLQALPGSVSAALHGVLSSVLACDVTSIVQWKAGPTPGLEVWETVETQGSDTEVHVGVLLTTPFGDELRRRAG